MNEIKKVESKTIMDIIQSPGFVSQMKAALPAHLTPDRMIRIAMTTLRKNTRLLECNQSSLLASIMTASQLGLSVDPIMGEAYLIPFKGECTLITGYKGLRKLAYNSGEISTITAEIVYQNDEHEVSLGTDQKLKHKPLLTGDRGDVLFVYAVAMMKNGDHQFVVMTIQQVNDIRDKSSGYKDAIRKGSDHPWISNWEEMAKKTAIRRLAKNLPLQSEKADAFIQAANEDEQTFDIEVDADQDQVQVLIPSKPPVTTEKPKIWGANHNEIPTEVLEAVRELCLSEAVDTTDEKILAFLQAKFKSQMGYQIPPKATFDRMFSIILDGVK